MGILEQIKKQISDNESGLIKMSPEDIKKAIDTIKAMTDPAALADGAEVAAMLKALLEGKPNPSSQKDQFAELKATVAEFGEGFEPFLPSDKTDIIAYIKKAERDNTPPDPVNPWECRIGLSRFLIPPINISYSKVGQVSSIGGGLRTASSTKFNSGHSETMLTMTLYFPTHEAIWGFEGGKKKIDFDLDDDRVIDQFASSLRGLITQFKYAPFLPIKNAHINGALGIKSVALQSMQVSTMDGFPFAVAVQLNLLKFNHEVYLPMVNSLDQGIHWGRFRQYLGRGAKRLNEIAGQDFLTTLANDQELQEAMEVDDLFNKARTKSQDRRKQTPDSVVEFNKQKEWDNGRVFDLFYPAHTPTKVVYPDLTFFESRDEIEIEGKRNFWQEMITGLGFNYAATEQASYENVNTYFAYQAGQKYIKDENMLLDEYLRLTDLTVTKMNPAEMQKYIDARLDRYVKDHGSDVSDQTLNEVESSIRGAWFGLMYKTWSTDPMLEKSFAYQEFMNNHTLIKEWEVPMKQLRIPEDSCFVQSVNVSLGNNIVRMQLQMEEEPSYQHIGALDTQATISMIVFGDDALTRLTRSFEFVNGLARLEHGHGVLGFFGIKNVLTTLCGMKYCMIKELNSESIENQPGAYRVTLQIVDFDVFQQKREMLSSKQQTDLIEAFSKRNPFLRIKQHWAAFSAYPDMPLAVRDDDGRILGHLDPDYYFKAFETMDEEYTDFETYNPQSHYTFGTSPDNPEQGIGLTLDKDGVEFLDGGMKPSGQKMGWWETNADQMLPSTPAVSGMTPLGDYQQPYVDGRPNPQKQFETMMKDTRHRDKHGRMIRAFPTYMLWLIDEGGNFRGVKLFDNFYGMSSVNDIALVRSEDSMDDTLILQLSNLYNRLGTPFRDLLDEGLYRDAKIINTNLNRLRNQTNGLTDELIGLDTIELQAGVRVHLRMGYSANPNNLETVFNGVIAEVTQGETVQVVCQSDAVELSAVINARDEGANTSKIDGSLFGSFSFSEPRDLMTRLLSMGGSAFRETVAHASRGQLFSENRFGIRHFGAILTDEMTDREKMLTDTRHSTVASVINTITSAQGDITAAPGSAIGDAAQTQGGQTAADVAGAANGVPAAGDALGTGGAALSTVSDIQSKVPAAASSAAFGAWDLMTSSLINLSKDRSYELYKRNIYPGNGTGIAQYMGGDFGDGGLAVGVDVPMGVGAEGGAFTTEAPKSPKEILSWAGIKDDLKDTSMNLSPLSAPFSNKFDGPRDLGGKFLHPFSNMLGLTNEIEDDDAEGGDEVSFKAFTYMKSVWDIFQTCAALLPNYIVAVRPFEDRSTVFYGKPHWLWTSAVIPVSKGLGKIEYTKPDKEMERIVKDVMDVLAKEKETDEEFYDRVSKSTGGVNADPNATIQGMSWSYGRVDQLPQTSKGFKGGKAYLPTRRGAASIGMHLPTNKDLKTDVERHLEIDGLPGQYSHPYYMDRAENPKPAAELTDDNVDDNTKWDPKKPNAALNEGDKESWPGQPGAWGFLPPEEEQYYIAMAWQYKGDHEHSDSNKADYRDGDAGKRIMAYNSRSKKGVIVTPGHWVKPKGARVAELSPDAAFTIDLQPTDELIFGFIDDSAELGPVKFGDNAVLPKTPTDDEITVGKTDYDVGPLPPFMMTKEAKKRRTDKKTGKLNDNVALYALTYGAVDGNVNVNYSDAKNGWVDEYGARASEVYLPEGIDEKKADQTWRELRKTLYDDKYIKQAIVGTFPALIAPPPPGTTKEQKDVREEQVATASKGLVDGFLDFMWKNSFHRGWAVLTADEEFYLASAALRDGSSLLRWSSEKLPDGGILAASGSILDGVGDFLEDPTSVLPGSGDDKPKFNFDAIHKVFELYLADDTGQKAIEYMKTHKEKGKSNGLISRATEEFREKIWNKIGDVFKSITTAIGSITTGVVNMLRMSMMVMKQGIEMATFAQKQANKLNKVFNDSIYYQAGPPGSLAFYVDNPFTREYHEPVVEVREPFQRVHMISSFANIINNQMTEYSGATTVVTATSGGGHPVTVHFDKGAPSDKQIETSVETGLKWEKPSGVGKVAHPIKSLESFSTHFNNGDQETSARRVAKWFLKESLKDIYGGDITIIGDPQIRPHDLLYISDVYERIYGMCEVEQVVHHFNSELGFVTSITPNAIVTINDPARWTMTEYVRQRLNGWNLRHQMQNTYGKTGRGGYVLPQQISLYELAKSNRSGLMGALSFTGGNTALIKDFAASAEIGQLAPGLKPEGFDTKGGAVWDAMKDFSTKDKPPLNPLDGGLGTFNASTGFIATPLIWAGWKWTRDNLMDQQSCYIQYLSKDGKPMYAGLAFNRGVAVGQQRSSTLFKDSLRIELPTTDKQGNGMISTDDLLGNLGWREKEINELVTDMDLYTNMTNARILKLAGRPTPANPANQEFKAVWVTLDNRPDYYTDGNTTDELTDTTLSAVEDGDTLLFSTDSEGSKYTFGRTSLRFAGIDSPELAHFLHRRPGAAAALDINNPGVQSFLWVNERLRQCTGDYGYSFAIRVPVKMVGDKDPIVNDEDTLDLYGNRVLGWIFADVGDPNTPDAKRKEELMARAASPYVEWDGYQDNGKPYTINWESVTKGFSNVYLFGLDSDIPEEGVEGGGNPKGPN